MLFWRFFIASIAITLVGVFTCNKYFAQLRRMFSQKHIYDTFLYSSSTVLFFLASKYIGIGLCMVILYIYPVFIILLSWIYDKEKIPKIYYVSIFLILAGMLLQLTKSDLAYNLYGVVLVIISAFTYALYVFINRHNSGAGSVFFDTTFLSFGSCVFCLLGAGLDRSLNFPLPSQLIDITLLGTICTLLPALLFLQAVKFIDAAKASILTILEPISSIVIGFYFLGKNISTLQFIGIVLIILSGILVQLDFSKKRSKR
jgi:drug/metabolite transporter (DMT)-like permease